MKRLAQISVTFSFFLLALFVVARAEARGEPPSRWLLQVIFQNEADARDFIKLVDSGIAFVAAGDRVGSRAADLGKISQTDFAGISGGALARRAFEMPLGGIVGPFRTDLGWHVVHAPLVTQLKDSWFPIGQAKDGTRYEMDASTVRGDRFHRRAWFRTTRKTAKVTVRTISYEAVDCPGRRLITIKTAEYRNGRVTKSEPALAESLVDYMMEPVIPDSIGAEMHRLICTFPAEAVQPLN